MAFPGVDLSQAFKVALATVDRAVIADEDYEEGIS